MTDWTEMTPLMQRAVTALLELPGENGDGLFLEPEDLSFRAKGQVRADQIAVACPPWVSRETRPDNRTHICDAVVSYDCAESFRGDIADLMLSMLRGVLGQFMVVETVRAIIWDREDPPNDRKLVLRFRVHGRHREWS